MCFFLHIGACKASCTCLYYKGLEKYDAVLYCVYFLLVHLWQICWNALSVVGVSIGASLVLERKNEELLLTEPCILFSKFRKRANML